MLNIHRDKSRPKGEGEYFVELTKNRDLDIVNCDRLGYWCDKPHLKHMVLGIMAQFSHYELFGHLLEEIPDTKEDSQNVNQHTYDAIALDELESSIESFTTNVLHSVCDSEHTLKQFIKYLRAQQHHV